ncbi:hypothetical protein WA026_004943 [Henosepilachna vigintioctopunctata]|uniref:Uncharacterized protein n=1 Tax=Henosepilachna vigintioctopunctata TaxID=420089 RepID=A0AAW1US54_9CUCU
MSEHLKGFHYFAESFKPHHHKMQNGFSESNFPLRLISLGNAASQVVGNMMRRSTLKSLVLTTSLMKQSKKAIMKDDISYTGSDSLYATRGWSSFLRINKSWCPPHSIAELRK